MKSYRFLALFSGVLTLLFALTGCTVPVMATGRYTAEDPGREDYAAVYQDKIFLHIKAPELHSGRAAYWDWAGTYELTGAGEIRPDMDRETGKLWNFYYTFLSKREGIVVNAVPSGAEASGHPVGDSAGSRRTTAAVKLFPPSETGTHRASVPRRWPKRLCPPYSSGWQALWTPFRQRTSVKLTSSPGRGGFPRW